MNKPLSITYSELPFVVSRGVTYSSGETVKVDLTGVLETLSVFYDEIWLPYPYGFDPRGPKLWSISIGADQYAQEQSMFGSLYEEYEKWQEQWKPLMQQGVLRILPPPIRDSNEIPRGYGDAILSKLRPDENGKLSIFPLLSGELALAIHALYSQKPSPEMFPFNPNQGTPVDTSTSRLAGVMALSLFQYCIPKLGALTAEQVLEVRDAVKSTKEGFVDFLYEHADDFEKRLKDGGESEIKAARKIVEREIGTKYDEFRRQLAAKRTGVWGTILDVGGKFLQIDASPWTPKFYGALLSGIFGSLGETTKAVEEARTNSNQAYQFIYSLESKVETHELGQKSPTVPPRSHVAFRHPEEESPDFFSFEDRTGKLVISTLITS